MLDGSTISRLIDEPVWRARRTVENGVPDSTTISVHPWTEQMLFDYIDYCR